MGLADLFIDLEMVNLERSIRRYVDELGIEMPKVVRQTFRLIMRDVISITSPKNNAQGRKAVARDINRAVFLLDPQKVNNKILKTAIQDREYDVVLLILKRLKSGNWSNLTAVVPFQPSLHTGVRDRRGRVQRPRTIATPDVSEHRKYVRATQGHVGYSRAGWAPGARLAGITLPSWVSRHTSNNGSAIDRSNVSDRPTMTAIHSGKSSDNLPRAQITKIIEKRAKTMSRDVDQILQGRASRYFK
jgi:hypothetical protein